MENNNRKNNYDEDLYSSNNSNTYFVQNSSYNNSNSNYNQFKSINVDENKNLNTSNNNILNNNLEKDFKDLKSYYISNAKSNSNLIPQNQRFRANLFNKMFIISSSGFIGYNLFLFLKHYPETFTNNHIKEMRILSSFLLLTAGYSYSMLNKTLTESYNELKENYSDNQIRNFVKNFYLENNNILNNEINMQREILASKNDQNNKNIVNFLKNDQYINNSSNTINDSNTTGHYESKYEFK